MVVQQVADSLAVRLVVLDTVDEDVCHLMVLGFFGCIDEPVSDHCGRTPVVAYFDAGIVFPYVLFLEVVRPWNWKYQVIGPDFTKTEVTGQLRGCEFFPVVFGFSEECVGGGFCAEAGDAQIRCFRQVHRI
jgi:hypothetical protein